MGLESEVLVPGLFNNMTVVRWAEKDVGKTVLELFAGSGPVLVGAKICRIDYVIVWHVLMSVSSHDVGG